MLEIQVDMDRHLEDAEFGVRVDGNNLHVPVEVGRLLDRFRIRTSDQFVAYVHTYPTAFATEFRWAPADLDHARETLFQQLRGHVSAGLLDFQPRSFQPGTGALAPPFRSRGSGER